MNQARIPEIKIIYSASSSRMRPGAAVRRASPAPVAQSRPAVRTAPVVGSARPRGLRLGVLNLLVATLFFYLAWWPINNAAFAPAVMNTPVPVSDAEWEAIGRMFSGGAERSAPGGAAESSPGRAEKPPAGRALSGQTRQVFIWGSLYGWLALVTGACCCLAMSAGAGLAAARGSPDRAPGMTLLLAAGGALVVGGTAAWFAYGQGFPQWMVKAAAGVFVVGSMGFGMLRRGNVRGLARLAGVAVVSAGAGGALAVYLGSLAGVEPEEYVWPPLLKQVRPFTESFGPSAGFALLLGTIFLVHSLYGWLLLIRSPKATGAAA